MASKAVRRIHGGLPWNLHIFFFVCMSVIITVWLYPVIVYSSCFTPVPRKGCASLVRPVLGICIYVLT